MKLKDLLAPFAVWKRAFEKPYTIKKPIDERPGSERYRGFHKNDFNKCIGCGSCETICQNRAIDMVPVKGQTAAKGDSGLRPQIDYGRCCWCALCVDICTTGSLTMSNEYIWVDNDPEVFRFVPGKGEKHWEKLEAGYKRADNYRLLNPARQKMGHESYSKAVGSFIEMVKGYSQEQAKKEADRCVECGICIASCPARMDIPAYIRAIRENNLEEGLRILYDTNPFPAVCGRVCTHRCEDACAMGHQGDAIAIRWLKRYIADQFPVKEQQKILAKETPKTARKVAVIGAGPGGLSAAYYLSLAGYAVTVYEQSPQAGGMLRYGIPEYRLPYDQLDKDIEVLASFGTKIVCNKSINAKAFNALIKSHDALYVSPGLSLPYRLGIEGEDHARVLSGLDVLAHVTAGKIPKLGKRVAVIGGGNVAMDAARTARRLGADVTILYRRREVDMPADQEEIDDARKEKISLVTQAIPIAIESKGKSKAVMVWGKARMVDQGPGKRPSPELIEGSTQKQEFDTIISAVGQGPELGFIDEKSGINIERYKLKTGKNGQTDNKKVFAGGDLVNAVKDAISAIADGHAAALAIDRFLSKGKK